MIKVPSVKIMVQNSEDGDADGVGPVKGGVTSVGDVSSSDGEGDPFSDSEGEGVMEVETPQLQIPYKPRPLSASAARAGRHFANADFSKRSRDVTARPRTAGRSRLRERRKMNALSKVSLELDHEKMNATRTSSALLYATGRTSRKTRRHSPPSKTGKARPQSSPTARSSVSPVSLRLLQRQSLRPRSALEQGRHRSFGHAARASHREKTIDAQREVFEAEIRSVMRFLIRQRQERDDGPQGSRKTKAKVLQPHKKVSASLSDIMQRLANACPNQEEGELLRRLDRAQRQLYIDTLFSSQREMARMRDRVRRLSACLSAASRNAAAVVSKRAEERGRSQLRQVFNAWRYTVRRVATERQILERLGRKLANRDVLWRGFGMLRVSVAASRARNVSRGVAQSQGKEIAMLREQVKQLQSELEDERAQHRATSYRLHQATASAGT
eukprot:g2998.t1